MSRWLSHAAILGVVVAQLAASARVEAAGRVFGPEPAATADAKALYEEGRRAYRLGNFKVALERWEAAYAKSDNPLLLYNISLAYKGLYGISSEVSDLRKARAVLDNFIKLAQADPSVDVDDAPERLAELETMIKEAEAGQPGPAPAPITSSDSDDDTETVLDRRDDPGRKRRVAGIATMGTGGALVAVGGTLSVFYLVVSRDLTTQLEQQLEDELVLCPGMEESDECLDIQSDIDNSRSEGNDANRNAYISLGVAGLGVVALIAGAVVYVQGNRKTQRWEKGLSKFNLKVTPSWSTRSSGVSISGRF